MEIFQINGNETYSIKIVGTSFHQKELEEIAGNANEGRVKKPITALLIEENDNNYDPNAVKIVVDDKKVGYLSKINAFHYRKLLSGLQRTGSTVSCKGLIVGGWNEEGDFGGGVRIDFPQML